MSAVPTIDVVNESSVMSDTDVMNITVALQHQVAYDFRPHWDAGCRLVQTKTVSPTSWALVILDDADQAGALGYHDLTAGGLPIGKVFARTTQDDGGEVSVTASHELLEMLADPWICNAVQIAATTFYALEVADACEADQYAYAAPNGVFVSDFVLPHWFTGHAAGPADFRGHISKPYQLLPGGYIGEWTPNSGWTQKTADTGAPPSRRIPLRRYKAQGIPLQRSTR